MRLIRGSTMKKFSINLIIKNDETGKETVFENISLSDDKDPFESFDNESEVILVNEFSDNEVVNKNA